MHASIDFYIIAINLGSCGPICFEIEICIVSLCTLRNFQELDTYSLESHFSNPL